ncbi:MAG: hypothetical protein AAFQ98_08745, partial [Bacteroidota bacterium]
CVFMTLFGEQPHEGFASFSTPMEVQTSIDRGLRWLSKAQHSSGGYGAGSHYHQNILDPHAVKPDPATTAMVGMAMLRTGSTLTSGPYQNQLQGTLNFLLEAVEQTPQNEIRITKETNTQIQTKLGHNIDAVLAAQYFSNLLDYVDHSPSLERRIRKSLEACTQKIAAAQQSDGSMSGDGWAGVLQSSLAGNALEAARYQGIEVEDTVLENAQSYQYNNMDVTTGEVDVDRGAGVVLYSVSSSVRGAARDARTVREAVRLAKEEGRIEDDAEVSAEVLQDIGYDREEAMELNTAYQVYDQAKATAQDDGVMNGFGNNGGEEFLSFLQTGESLIINKDETWTDWYDNVSGKLVAIQNRDGSWNGHHCITSPVFCTATTLLTLAITNDVEKLVAQGAMKLD